MDAMRGGFMTRVTVVVCRCITKIITEKVKRENKHLKKFISPFLKLREYN